MAQEKSEIIRILLSPIALFYGIGVTFRNWLFDNNLLLHSKNFEQQTIIVVGNITMGGTGKTPFTEYLIRLLKDEFKVAMLSRGYKRQTKGYVLANDQSTPSQIGDEPYQIKQKYPDIAVGVDENRCEGIESMNRDLIPQPDVFVLDDAFQHRYVNPNLSVLLVDFNRLITKDHLFPMGMLREPVGAKDRANIVVVTKCPVDIKPIDLRVLAKEMNLYPYQKIYFTTTAYQEIQPLFAGEGALSIAQLKDCNILAVSGISSPEPFEEFLRQQSKAVATLRFRDHHNFSAADYLKIQTALENLGPEQKVILTTEKDAVRMQNDANLPAFLKENIYYLPLEIKFVNNEDQFRKQIRGYIEENKQYMRVSEK